MALGGTAVIAAAHGPGFGVGAGTVFGLPWTGSLVRALPHAGGGPIGAAVFLGVAPSAAGFALWACAVSGWTSDGSRPACTWCRATAIVISLV